MKSAFIPIFCGIVLTAISAAGFSHWFSVRELVLAYNAKAPILQPPSSPRTAPAPPVREKTKPAPTPAAVAETPAAPAAPAKPAATANASEEFFKTLLEEVKGVKSENRMLMDQLEETNRDLMSMQFRLDTHSTQFRPLPVLNEPREMTPSHDLEPVEGVLPPLDVNYPLPER